MHPRGNRHSQPSSLPTQTGTPQSQSSIELDNQPTSQPGTRPASRARRVWNHAKEAARTFTYPIPPDTRPETLPLHNMGNRPADQSGNQPAQWEYWQGGPLGSLPGNLPGNQPGNQPTPPGAQQLPVGNQEPQSSGEVPPTLDGPPRSAPPQDTLLDLLERPQQRDFDVSVPQHNPDVSVPKLNPDSSVPQSNPDVSVPQRNPDVSVSQRSPVVFVPPPSHPPGRTNQPPSQSNYGALVQGLRTPPSIQQSHSGSPSENNSGASSWSVHEPTGLAILPPTQGSYQPPEWRLQDTLNEQHQSSNQQTPIIVPGWSPLPLLPPSSRQRPHTSVQEPGPSDFLPGGAPLQPGPSDPPLGGTPLQPQDENSPAWPSVQPPRYSRVDRQRDRPDRHDHPPRGTPREPRELDTLSGIAQHRPTPVRESGRQPTRFDTPRSEPSSRQPRMRNRQPRSSSQKPEPSSENTEPSSQNPQPRSQNPEPSSQTPHSSSQQPQPSSQQPQSSSQKPELSSQKPELSSQKPQLRNRPPSLIFPNPLSAETQHPLLPNPPELRSQQPQPSNALTSEITPDSRGWINYSTNPFVAPTQFQPSGENPESDSQKPEPSSQKPEPSSPPSSSVTSTGPSWIDYTPNPIDTQAQPPTPPTSPRPVATSTTSNEPRSRSWSPDDDNLVTVPSHPTESVPVHIGPVPPPSSSAVSDIPTIVLVPPSDSDSGNVGPAPSPSSSANADNPAFDPVHPTDPDPDYQPPVPPTSPRPAVTLTTSDAPHLFSLTPGDNNLVVLPDHPTDPDPDYIGPAPPPSSSAVADNPTIVLISPSDSDPGDVGPATPRASRSSTPSPSREAHEPQPGGSSKRLRQRASDDGASALRRGRRVLRGGCWDEGVDDLAMVQRLSRAFQQRDPDGVKPWTWMKELKQKGGSKRFVDLVTNVRFAMRTVDVERVGRLIEEELGVQHRLEEQRRTADTPVQGQKRENGQGIDGRVESSKRRRPGPQVLLERPRPKKAQPDRQAQPNRQAQPSPQSNDNGSQSAPRQQSKRARGQVKRARNEIEHPNGRSWRAKKHLIELQMKRNGVNVKLNEIKVEQGQIELERGEALNKFEARQLAAEERENELVLQVQELEKQISEAEALAENAVAEKAVAEKAVAEKVAAKKAAAQKAVAEKAAAQKTVAEKAVAEKAVDPQVGQTGRGGADDRESGYGGGRRPYAEFMVQPTLKERSWTLDTQVQDEEGEHAGSEAQRVDSEELPAEFLRKPKESPKSEGLLVSDDDGEHARIDMKRGECPQPQVTLSGVDVCIRSMAMAMAAMWSSASEIVLGLLRLAFVPNRALWYGALFLDTASTLWPRFYDECDNFELDPSPLRVPVQERLCEVIQDLDELKQMLVEHTQMMSEVTQMMGDDRQKLVEHAQKLGEMHAAIRDISARQFTLVRQGRQMEARTRVLAMLAHRLEEQEYCAAIPIPIPAEPGKPADGPVFEASIDYIPAWKTGADAIAEALVRMTVDWPPGKTGRGGADVEPADAGRGRQRNRQRLLDGHPLREGEPFREGEQSPDGERLCRRC
ncbi:hypothetical protein EJ06DRAFT_249465 [Trichodelitschia bisporula]|uniref:Uncharacterized protein n=1 Tax=Trichodelitschia bisporula TaxID=703511 RepID=A0A6G1HJP4_9PEZI|nr:hypothetical protein EJ06DRAFT_249465 [Trichodelitschia bisporula]